MTIIRDFFAAIVKSLMRGKSFLDALLAFWVSPKPRKSLSVDGSADEDPVDTHHADGHPRTVHDFLKEAETLFVGSIHGVGLTDFASGLKAQFRVGLRSNPACMLPSYNHQLPNGAEKGHYLCLDVGGSTVRVALVELRSRAAPGQESGIVRMRTFHVDPETKKLEGMAFFDWLAGRILDTLSGDLEQSNSPAKPLLVGMAWSFPIEQTSLKGGLLQGMGKGYSAANGLTGQDLGDIIQRACQKRDLHVELAAIVNDSAAALLSEAYIEASTRFSLILGTGVNIAVHLPVATIGRPKFGNRPAAWFHKASHVIVNTELGMFGKDILPMTRWDRQLNASHPKPEFQPLEHLVSGFYLGEIVRLALLEAIQSTGIFGAVLPESLRQPYSLSTETLSLIEADRTPSLETACSVFQSHHPSPVAPNHADLAVVKALASYASQRSAAVVAASLFALWDLKVEAETELLGPASSASSAQQQARTELGLARTLVAFNGSVIENYPGYRPRCQKYIDELMSSAKKGAGGGAGVPSMSLVEARESSLRGAAVALACLQEGGAN